MWERKANIPSMPTFLNSSRAATSSDCASPPAGCISCWSSSDIPSNFLKFDFANAIVLDGSDYIGTQLVQFFVDPIA